MPSLFDHEFFKLSIWFLIIVALALLSIYFFCGNTAQACRGVL